MIKEKNRNLIYCAMICLITSFVILIQPLHAKDDDKYLTRGEAAVMLSATDYMKEKIGQLLDFTVGYALPTFNRATLAPVMKYIKVDPLKIVLDKNLLFKFMVFVDNPGGLSQIEEVGLDASSLGKPLGLKMVDNGFWGDEVANDGIFTLQDRINPGIDPGQKEITISVVNKKGWMSVARADVIVEQGLEPRVETYANPQRIMAEKSSKVVLTVIPKNYSTDITNMNAHADLSAFGLGNKVQMMKKGQTFYLETDLNGGRDKGEKKIPIRILDTSGGFIDSKITIEVIK